jgi:hypothetical protein
MKNLSFIFLLIVSLFVLAGCGVSGINFGYAGTNRDGNMSYTYLSFNSSEKHTVELSSGVTLSLDVSAEVLEGDLEFKVLNPDNEVIWSLAAEEDVNQTAEVSVEESGFYNLVVEGIQTKGNFKLKWEN